MPKNKDFKRLVRARMEKTGESYTAARAQIAGPESAGPKSDVRSEVATPEAAPTSTAPESTEGWAALAGVSDDTLQEKTGRDWAAWVEALDAIGAQEMTHRDIARHVSASLDGWWAQTVTVGYERIRGLRPTHGKRDGTFNASKSKTFSVPVDVLYAAFAQKRQRERWLGDVALHVRSSQKHRSMRISWPDGTSVEPWFTDKGPNKSTVSVQHTKLASAEAVAASKAFWNERLGALAALLKRG